jgi:hypothetical protein
MLITLLFFVTPTFAAPTTTDQLDHLGTQPVQMIEVDGDELPEILDIEADRKPAVMELGIKNESEYSDY